VPKNNISVEVVYGLADRQVLLNIKVPAGTTVYEAVRQSDIVKHFPDADIDNARMGIYSKAIADPRQHVLKEGDRVEIYRPLIIDPKEARRRRADAARSERATS
jgi:putative ubiquitin-RnfH superfamily antitoxin RatB of RatAB toxin-antitoxin module